MALEHVKALPARASCARHAQKGLSLQSGESSAEALGQRGGVVRERDGFEVALHVNKLLLMVKFTCFWYMLFT